MFSIVEKGDDERLGSTRDFGSAIRLLQQDGVSVGFVDHDSMRYSRAAERQSYSDEDYSEGDKLD